MMQDKKKEIKWFDITQYEQEAEYLRNMNKKGWKFTGVKFPSRCFRIAAGNIYWILPDIVISEKPHRKWSRRNPFSVMMSQD